MKQGGGRVESLLRNTLFGTRPIIVHNHGRRHPNSAAWFQRLLDRLLAIETAPILHPDVDVFAWSNESRTGVFERCCRHLGIGCTIIGREHVTWANRLKLTTAIDALQRSSKPYVLFADACDVGVFRDIRALLPLPRGCRLLFNAENNHYPDDIPTDEFERSVASSPFQYLNA